MTPEEAKSTIEELKQEGLSEEEILYSFYRMFQDDKITVEGLEGLVETLGWHLTEDFKAMSPEDQKTKGYEEIEDEAEEGVSEEEVEAAKEIPAEESKEEDEKKAMKLFGMK